MEIFIPVVLLLVLLALGIPVAISLALAGSIGIWMMVGLVPLLGILATAPQSALGSYELLTIPMFILMAELMGMSGISSSLFKAVAAWAGKIRGGLGISTVITGALFGAVSGSSTASAATLARTALPTMLEYNYRPGYSAGIVAMAGTIAMLIPPSVALIFYGLLSGANISALLIAGITPGVLVTVVLSLVVWLTVERNKTDESKEQPHFTWAEKVHSLKVALPFVSLFGVVTGLIYSGIATPVESSALGATAALLYTLINRSFSFVAFRQAMIDTCLVTAMIGLIMVCAQLFSYFVTVSGLALDLAAMIVGSGMPVWQILALIVVLYLFLGLFLDLISILILTVPVLLPIIQQLGLDPIWFGVVAILLAEIGIVTPPVGMNVFVIARVSGIPLADCFRGVTLPVLATLALVIVVVAWPDLVLWLPNTMK